MALTDLKIRKALTREKAYKIFDRDGLYILVFPSGSKAWKFKYKYAGKEKLLSLDKFPQVSVAEAREKQLEARKLLSKGIDPSNQKREDRQQAAFKACNTFEGMTKQWHEDTKHKWVPDYAEDILCRMQNHLFPSLGHRAIDSIKPLEILAILKRIEAKGHLETVHKLLGYTQNVFSYAVVTGLVETNPARELGIAIKTNHKKHYPTIKASELPAFLSALENTKTKKQNKLTVMLLLLTFLRTGELRKSKWEHIDFENRIWKVPGEIMKMKLPHIVPMSEQVVTALKELRDIKGYSEYLFPNNYTRTQPYISENLVNYVIKKMGYKGKIVGHGFRSLASTTLNEHGFNKDAIERQLAHKEPNQIRAAYNHAEYMPERIEMMQWWGNQIMVNSIHCRN